MLMLTIVALTALIVLGRELVRLEPPRQPAYANLFLGPGRHLWLIEDRSSKACLGVIAGGWKELKNSELVKFTALTAGPTTSTLRASISEYNLMQSVQIRVSGPAMQREIAYNGKSWSGIETPTTEPILLLESRGGGRTLKLPNRLARQLNLQITSRAVQFRQVRRGEFFACKRELKAVKSEIGKETL